MKYIVASNVRKLAKEHGKRVSHDFLLALDQMVFEKVVSASKIWDGGRKTLTASHITFTTKKGA